MTRKHNRQKKKTLTRFSETSSVGVNKAEKYFLYFTCFRLLFKYTLKRIHKICLKVKDRCETGVNIVTVAVCVLSAYLFGRCHKLLLFS